MYKRQALSVVGVFSQILTLVSVVKIGVVLTEAVTAVLTFEVHPKGEASAKYVVVEFKKGVVKVVPVAIGVPPVAEVYQLITGTFVVTPRVTTPGLQISAAVVEIILGICLLYTSRCV